MKRDILCARFAGPQETLRLWLLRDGGQLMRPDRLDLLALAHEILTLHDHPAAVGDPGDPHCRLLVLYHCDRRETDSVVGVDDAHAELAARGECQRGTRQSR